MTYRNEECPECGRHRVQNNGICEKCRWSVDADEYITLEEELEAERRASGEQDTPDVLEMMSGRER